MPVRRLAGVQDGAGNPAPQQRAQAGIDQREELVHAEDLKNYFRVPSDTRDLNYGKYFEVGESKLSLEHDYTSGNTRQLTQQELIAMLMKLEYIQKELAGENQKADEGF